MRNVGSKAPGTGAKATAGKATPTQVADRTGAPTAPGTKIAPSIQPAPSTTAKAPAAPSPKGPTVEDVGTRVPEPAKLDTGERVQAPARPAAPKRSWLGLQAERMAVAEPKRREPAVLPPRRAPEPQVARAIAQDATAAARPAPAAAVPRALVERHLKALLSKSEYSDAL